MQFQPGNTAAAKGRRWRDAINDALEHKSRKDQIDALRAAAGALVDQALAGDMQALKELGDRLDGKPTQMIGSDPDTPVLMKWARPSE